MTEERYLRLFDIQFSTYYLNSPIEFIKGALLLDRASELVVLQLKFGVLAFPKNVSSFIVKVLCYDDEGLEIPQNDVVFHSYRDINLLTDSSFGDKTPILLDQRTRKIKVDFEKVTFTDGSTWIPPQERLTPPAQEGIQGLGREMKDQVERSKNLIPARMWKYINYLPVQQNQYWQCTCGRPNDNVDHQCCRCGFDKSSLFENLEIESIQQNLEKYKEEQKKQQEIRAEKIAELKHQAVLLLKGLGVAAITGFVLFVFYFAITRYAIPFYQFNQASTSLEKHNFDQSIDQFTALGPFNNADQMVIEAKFQQANDFLQKKEYDSALQLYNEITPYKESKASIKLCLYEKAKLLLIEKKFDEAITLFTSVIDYSDSSTYVSEATYQKAIYLLEHKQYDQAGELFDQLGIFKDSKEYFKQTYYEFAKQMMANKQYSMAIEYFPAASEYKDSLELMAKCHYLLAEDFYQRKEWQKAISEYALAGEKYFPDVVEKIPFAQTALQEERNLSDYNLAKQKVASGDYLAAYNLLKDLDYKDSKKLALEYKPKAFAWRIDGGSVKSSYSRSERFSISFYVKGGYPNDFVNIYVTCTTPDWTQKSEIKKAVAGDYFGWDFWNIDSFYGSTGTGTFRVFNTATGESLALYNFNITY